MAGQELTDHRSGPAVTIGDLEIEPIARVVVRVESVSGAIVGMGLKEPTALVIRSPAGTWRVDLEHLHDEKSTSGVN